MTYVQLGKFGDVMSVLPMLSKGDRLVVSQDYASVLDGVSYVEPVVYPGHASEIGKALAANPGAKSIQINGPIDQTREFTYKPAGQSGAQTTSFQIESWHIAGKLKQWYEYPPLVFDRRDAAREKDLLDQWTPKPRWNRKKLVLFFCGGETSPFPYKPLLRELVRLVFDKVGYGIVDLEQVKAERIYDLLALYEQAHVLIATDSAPLHLARACPKLPVVALCNDKPLAWHGSAWQPNFIWYCRYSDFIQRAHEIARIPDFIAHRETPREVFQIVTGTYEENSWVRPYVIWPGSTGRDSRNTVGDEQAHPYLKDVLRMGLTQVSIDEMVLVSRSDTRFSASIPIPNTTPAYCYRMKRNGGGHDEFSPIVDAFYAKASWWREHLKEIPDLIMGRDVYWSQCLWAMFKKYGAYDATGMVYRIPPETKPEPQSLDKPIPRISHNVTLTEAYVKSSGVTSRYPKVSEQVELIPLQTEKLFPFGYNPSIIEYKGEMLMAYRFHEGTVRSKLALAHINEAGQVSKNEVLPAKGFCLEDPKFWVMNGQLFMSWVESDYPQEMKCSVRYGQFVDGYLNEIARPDYGQNNGTTMEKNWVFFNHNEATYFIYKSSPKQIIVKWNGVFEEQYETEGPKWAYGPIKGGTRPVPYGENLLRFWHGSLDNEYGRWPRRYYIGACVTKNVPPFDVIACSKKPIIYGSEIGPVKPKDYPIHHKGNVVFEGGVLEREWGWLLSIGINDSACGIAKITPEMLNL